MQYIGIAFSVAFCVALAKNLESILEAVGGKLAEYLVQARDFDMYIGASGLNASSSLSILLAISFLHIVMKPDFLDKNQPAQFTAYFALASSIAIGSLILFSGIFSIIGDRIWQLGMPILLLMLHFLTNTYNRNEKLEKLPFLDRPLTLPGVNNLLINIVLFYYVVIGLLFRYPQSNFFSWITGPSTLIPPNAY